MGTYGFVVGASLVLAGVAAVYLWPRWRARRNADALTKANRLFHLRREWLEVDFVSLASKNDQASGLKWQECDFEDEAIFATDRQTGELRAFVSVSVGMESACDEDDLFDDFAMVGNLRAATAVFNFDGRNWSPAGRAILNLNPMEAVEHFHHELEMVD